MTQLLATVLKTSFLIVLWLFIFFVVLSTRKEIFGNKIKNTFANTPKTVTPPPTIDKPENLSGLKIAQENSANELEFTEFFPFTQNHETITIGRNPHSTIVLQEDAFASSQHCEIFYSEPFWYLRDLGSTNGTIIDQKIAPENASIQLELNSRITIGNTTIIVV